MNKEQYIISGLAFWPKLAEKNELSGKYQLDISLVEDSVIRSADGKNDIISADPKSFLKSKGVVIKNGKDLKKQQEDERKDFVTASSKEFKPRVIDVNNKSIPEDVLIGNGSKVNVLVNIFDWKFKNSSGKSLGLSAVQVAELVAYTSSRVEPFVAEAKDNSSDTGQMPF